MKKAAIPRRRPRSVRERRAVRGAKPAPKAIRTLSIDIGGTGLKASVLDEHGQMLTERARTETPHPSPPDIVVTALADLVSNLPGFDRVSVGFPGVVRNGKIVTAPNLDTALWHGFDLEAELERQFGKPVRILNDADLQGHAAVEGQGVELVITLGTGFGTAFFRDGRLLPHMELAHHPFRKEKSYEEYVGNLARKEVGNEKWSKRVLRVIDTLRNLFNFDRIHVGGGNTKHLTIELPSDARIVSNEMGILGGIALWREDAS